MSSIFLQIFGATILATFGVVTVRVFLERLVKGRGDIIETREEGGGAGPKIRGELHRGYRRPSSARGHGLHILAANGKIWFRAKSVVPRHR